MIYVVPTIDVEAIRSLNVLGDFSKLILGEIDNNRYGIEKIISTIKKFNGTGTFFIDYAESGHGLNKLRYITKIVEENKCEVGLHIHPQFIADISRYLLNEYSYDEQKEIFRKCINNYLECSELKNLKTFRAGGYGADDNTMSVLRENNILCDSSYFRNHKWCKISPKPLNIISKSDEIVHFPITVFNNLRHYKIFGINIFKRKFLKKTDIDSLEIQEIDQIIDFYEKKGEGIINLFMHSYSLISWSPDYSEYKINMKNIQKLEYFLKRATEKEFQIVSISRAIDIWNNGKQDSEFLPEISTFRSIFKSIIIFCEVWRRKKIRNKIHYK